MLLPTFSDLLPDGCVVTGIVPRTGGSLSTVYEVRLAGAALPA